MNWRKINNIIHRDLGYAAVGLTIIYSISGIAVNHVRDWNPNYVIDTETVEFIPRTDTGYSKESAFIYVLEQLEITDLPKESFRTKPTSIQLFYDDKTITADLKTGKASIEQISSRRVFRESNFLHLNVPKGLWTWVADIFGFSLILLAVTGLFVLKGKKGLNGRGKWFVALGFLIPLVFLIIYY